MTHMSEIYESSGGEVTREGKGKRSVWFSCFGADSETQNEKVLAFKSLTCQEQRGNKIS